MSLEDVTSTPFAKLKPRDPESHKGNYGRVMIIGGSRGMSGAPSLAGKAALRCGAGLVTLAVPRSIQSTVSAFEPSYMTHGLGDSADDGLQENQFDGILSYASRMDAIALGPGMGTATGTTSLVRELYQAVKQPMVVDADGLNALAQEIETLGSPPGPRILTPHPGEFERLSGERCAEDLAARAEQAANVCRRDSSGSTIMLLKGHRTIITDGLRYAINSTGNPGMATGGAGDCLTGIITALVGQGLSPWDATRLGAYVHGRAGDLAAVELGQTSMIASDIVDFLPAAFRGYQDKE